MNPFTLRAIATLSALYIQQGRKAEALKVGGEGLEKSRKILEEEHHKTAQAKCLMALIYWQCGMTSKAIEIAKRGLEQL